MKRDKQKFLFIKNNKNLTSASFNNVNRLTILNSEAIRLELIDIATQKNSVLDINLEGIRFVDSSIIDILNLLSRMAHRYNSKVVLSNVTDELFELIELVKMHSVFDIKQVKKSYLPRSVA